MEMEKTECDGNKQIGHETNDPETAKKKKKRENETATVAPRLDRRQRRGRAGREQGGALGVPLRPRGGGQHLLPRGGRHPPARLHEEASDRVPFVLVSPLAPIELHEEASDLHTGFVEPSCPAWRATTLKSDPVPLVLKEFVCCWLRHDLEA